MRRVFFGVLVGVAALGCGDHGPTPVTIQTAPVSGTANYEGKPLEDYRIFFFNMGDAAQEPATDRIKADGSFTLSVRQPGDGAIIGMNQVWLKYDPELPPEVPGQESGTPPPPPKVKLPEKYLDRKTSGITVDVPAEGLKDYKLDLK